MATPKSVEASLVCMFLDKYFWVDSSTPEFVPELVRESVDPCFKHSMRLAQQKNAKKYGKHPYSENTWSGWHQAYGSGIVRDEKVDFILARTKEKPFTRGMRLKTYSRKAANRRARVIQRSLEEEYMWKALERYEERSERFMRKVAFETKLEWKIEERLVRVVDNDAIADMVMMANHQRDYVQAALNNSWFVPDPD